MTTNKTNLSIYDYLDYRLFLKSHLYEKKKSNPRWNYSSWSKILKFKDKSSLGKILQGRRHPGEKITSKLVAYFQFSAKEEHYFRNLVSLQKNKSDLEQGQLLITNLNKRVGKNHFNLDLDTFALLSEWYP
ncbi:MAG: TIGR02147 family protein, partial [Oligoflexia bacterium]|nr:TIGR02147 family protein [Oligoflexia bacterium]